MATIGAWPRPCEIAQRLEALAVAFQLELAHGAAGLLLEPLHAA
jgi:hypothetical protein